MLLEQYTRLGAEDAFAALVREYLDLVYSAALRATRSPQLAEEVAQAAMRVQTDSDDDVRKGLSLLRTLAKSKVAPALSGALQGYLAANNGDPPTSMDQLKPFLQEPLDDAVLDRYEPHVGGNTNAPGYNPRDNIRLRDKADAIIDATYDPRFVLGPKGFGYRAQDGAILPDAPAVPAGASVFKMSQ